MPCPQRETFVPVDGSGQALRNAIVWMDVRASELMDELGVTLGPGAFHRVTGKPLSGNLTLLKIEWLRRHEPQVWGRAARFLDVAAYLNQPDRGLRHRLGHRRTGRTGGLEQPPLRPTGVGFPGFGAHVSRHCIPPGP